MIEIVSMRRKNIGEISNTEGTTDRQSDRSNHNADRSIDETVLGLGLSDI
jgi:hypothetical protein